MIRFESDENGNLLLKEQDPVISCMTQLVLSISDERKKQRISQVRLAEMTGMPQSTISRIESFRTVPTLQVLIKIAMTLGLSLSIQKKAEVPLCPTK